jgi:calcineurin-like phosphoesterase family protein
VEEMNKALIAKWNSVVREDDIVFFLGDLAVGYNPLHWLDMLNGDIVFIRGSHDRCGAPLAYYHEFLLIHNPDYAPSGWNGWVIHGHTHNNDIINYPFLNKERKTINVSAELVNFTPVSLDKIREAIAMVTSTCAVRQFEQERVI